MPMHVPTMCISLPEVYHQNHTCTILGIRLTLRIVYARWFFLFWLTTKHHQMQSGNKGETNHLTCSLLNVFTVRICWLVIPGMMLVWLTCCRWYGICPGEATVWVAKVLLDGTFSWFVRSRRSDSLFISWLSPKLALSVFDAQHKINWNWFVIMYIHSIKKL